MDEQRHVALPKLTGAPAYARPPIVPAAPVARPVGPDDLPLAAEMTEEDLALMSTGAGAQGSASPASSGAGDASSLQPRPFSIRAIAERIRRPRP